MSRRSLPLKDSLAHVASPLRQTSMLNRSGNDSSVLLENDDDAERSELRRSAELQMLQQEVTPTSEKRRSIGSLAELSPAELTEHYYNCIKLSAENKINAKNAFSLHLIDYMAMMLKRRDPKMDNLQLASYNLDASTKIYAERVDCVLADARKMARRLAVGECKIQPERDEGEGRKETKRKEDEDDDYCEELVKPNGVPLPAQLQDVHNAATLDEFAGDNLIAAPPSKSSSPNTRGQDSQFQEEGET